MWQNTNRSKHQQRHLSFFPTDMILSSEMEQAQKMPWNQQHHLPLSWWFYTNSIAHLILLEHLQICRILHTKDLKFILLNTPSLPTRHLMNWREHKHKCQNLKNDFLRRQPITMQEKKSTIWRKNILSKCYSSAI